MIQTIVVAIDGSGFANRAVASGADLAAACGARLVLLTVLAETGLPPELAEYAGLEDVYVDEVMAWLLDQAREEATRHGAINVVCRQAEGPPAASILAVAEETDADVIIMGRRGLGAVRELLLGSVSRHVAEAATCTCMTVP